MELLSRLYENEAVAHFLDRSAKFGNLSLIEEALIIAAAFQKKPQQIIIVKSNYYTAQRLAQRLTPLLKTPVLLYGVEESLRMETIARSPEMRAAQMETLAALQSDKPQICITHSAGVMRYLCDPKQFQQHTIHLHTDEEYPLEQLKSDLMAAGYDPVSRVDQPLCFASRGGIIDVYSINYDLPIRIEFFDNEIESIRFFDIGTQRTVEVRQAVDIIPAGEYLFTDEEMDIIAKECEASLAKSQHQEHLATLQATMEQEMEDLRHHRSGGNLYKYFACLPHHYTLLDYMKQPYVIFSSEEEIRQSIHHIQEETIAYIQEMSQAGLAPEKFSLFADPFQEISHKDHCMIGMFADFHHSESAHILTHTIQNVSLVAMMDEIIKEAQTYDVLLSLDKKEVRIICDYFNERAIPYTVLENMERLPKGISVIEGTLSEGFRCTKEKISVYTSRELFHRKEKTTRFANKFKEAEVLHDYMELTPGDYIVHHQYGVGQYMGIVNKVMDGVHKDFLNIAYKGNDVLLVPLEQFHFIRKFISKEGAVPKLNQLGSGDWEKTKQKVSGKIAELAERLIALYSLREERNGFAFSKDTPFQKQFEDDFSYELTEDQKRAVAEIKRDMEADKPMDRLLCGDVGFGKTEVAIRAAFKAIMDQKQVAFLCPTTILSLQHYRTFQERFANYPVNIAVLNRFVTPAAAAKIKSDLKAGKIDILIGTHRILSKDIKFHDLGFLVIDEEQRFGVEHKEKIKEMRTEIDVLSMSATPIPRTLQMSLVGVRSLSQLETPPLHRLPVQTYVIEKDFGMIKEIIQRELGRGGQVFYLFNNVNEIYQVAARLKEALPDAQIAVAHGKMNREEIEDVMIRFTENEYQVLVCTTIIETGIDIPNANTIIIDQADRFGLSQLYQIKGRVGRSDRLAYAYLMYSPDKQLSEVAMKRLKSIKEFAQLGSGYKIAMRDLAIRGAGDMLGPQQAGFIDTVGMDMYIEMLNEAITQRKGTPKPQETSAQTPGTTLSKRANTKVDAYIPAQFAPQDYEKIKLYQQIESITTKEQLRSFMEEIQDNYGRLPHAVQLLFEKKRLDILINEPHIEDFKEFPQQIKLVFTQGWSNHIDGVKLFEMMTTLCREAQIRYANQKITMTMPKNRSWLNVVIEILEQTQHMEQRKQ